jgi:hypothetical protein
VELGGGSFSPLPAKTAIGFIQDAGQMCAILSEIIWRNIPFLPFKEHLPQMKRKLFIQQSIFSIFAKRCFN